MTSPSVSVVMPVYNVERYVGAAIGSVLGQTFTDFELLIIDDAGLDGSLDICRSFSDPRIRIISQGNRGLAGARNTGIRYARGQYVAFLDSDDLWHCEKLERHIRHLESDCRLGLSYSGARLIDDEGRPIGISQKPMLNDVKPHHVFLRNPVSNGSTPVIRRAALDAIEHDGMRPGEKAWFDESFRQSEDIECWLRLVLRTGYEIGGISGDLTDYRVNAGGLSANVQSQYESWLNVRAKVKNYAPQFEARWGDRAEAYQLRYLARRAIRMRERALSLEFATRAVRKSLGILLDEPLKTMVTLGAAAGLNLLPRALYCRIEQLAMQRITT